MKILLLEDDLGVADALTRALTNGQNEVVWTDNNVEANEILSRGGIDIAVFDFNVREHARGLNNAKSTTLLPLSIPVCINSGLPEDAQRELRRLGIEGVPVFSKGDPFELIKWIEEQA